MKRSGNRLESILELDNWRLAFRRATRGKRNHPDVVAIAADLDHYLTEMSAQVRAGTFPVGVCSQFVIRDPKQRVITAPCMRERILHHAILNVCEPDFECFLIDDTFACRKGKGRIKGLLRARSFAGRFRYFLKMDIRRYFDSIGHDCLLERLRRRFKEARVLALFARIIRSFRGGMGRGLPIGALTSQHFANFYLGWFDRFVKEQLRITGYTRYMDDIALWSNDREQLDDARNRCETFLREELGLDAKPEPYLNRTRHGMDYLGCRIFPHHMTLNRRSRLRFRRKLLALEQSYLADEIDEMELQQRATALVSFTQTEGLSAWRYREATLATMPVSGRRARTG